MFCARAQEFKTTVTPLESEEILKPCEYRMVIPNAAHPVRAVWAIWDRGMDFVYWYYDADVRALAREFDLALVLPAHCRSKEREDMIVLPEKGVGRAFFTALDQFAAAEYRPELARVAVIHIGWSGAGSLAARMAGYRSARYLAGIDYAPGQYEPLGMDTIELPAEALRAPQLIIANGGDQVNGTERPYGYFRKYFERGARWTFAVQNRTPHCCLQNAKELILSWVRGVLLQVGGDRFGYLTPVTAEVVDTWKRPVFNARSARVAGRRGMAREGEIEAGWLPSAEFAGEWLSFERRAEPPAIWKP